jgi:hypothetical protein
LATLVVGLVTAVPAYFVFFEDDKLPTSTLRFPTTSVTVPTTVPDTEPTTTDFPPEVESTLGRAPQNAVQINWTTSASDYVDDIGKEFAFVCPPRGIAQEIWGTDLYTFDSPICPAAVHAGQIMLARGGTVVIKIREGAQEYPASTRHGITSSRWGEYYGSYEFVS